MNFSHQGVCCDGVWCQKDIARQEWLRYAALSYTGLKTSWLDKSFVDRGRTYNIVGYEPGRKYSVKTTRDDGKTYNWLDSCVAQKLGTRGKAA